MMKFGVSRRSQRDLKVFLLSATALVAVGAFVALPAKAEIYQYATPGPHTDAIVVDDATDRMYADNGVVATFAGIVTYQADLFGLLVFGNGGATTGTIVFAPTAINFSPGRNILRLEGGTLRLGNTIARNFIANGAELQLGSGALDMNGANLTVRNITDSAGSRIVNDAAGTTATLTVNLPAWIGGLRSTIADGAGTLGVRIEGSNPVTLFGNNTYSGGTIITGGSNLTAASSTALGTGILRFDGLGGELHLNNGVTLANNINFAANSTAVFDVGAGNSGRLNGAITAAGFADFFKVSDGELVIGGSLDTSRVFLNRGTLTSAVGGNISDTASVGVNANGAFNVLGDEKVYEVIGAGQVTLANGATLTLGRDPAGGTDYATTSVNMIMGDGGLVKQGGNRLTLRGANTYAGGTVLAGGTLVAGVTGALGTGEIQIDGVGTVLALSNNVRLNNEVYIESGDLNVAVDTGRATLAGRIGGNASPAAEDFRKQGAGTLVLGGAGSEFNDVHLDGGVLQVDGGIVAQTLSVADGAGLAGSGTVAADILVAAGGSLHGRADQTLTITGNLALNNSSNIDVALGAPDTRALFDVSGNLVLDGRLNITDAGSFGSGVYRLFDYDGALTNNTLDVNTVPAGTTATVQTALANQVNILVTASNGPVWQFWDGSQTTSNGQVDGGTGNWNSLTNWTDANGTSNSAWAGGYAAFQGAAGNVTIAPGGVSVAGMQFVTNGYQLNGGPITLSEAQTVIRVGDGSGSGMSAIIHSNITGAGGLVKEDVGNLYLTGNNSYQGATIVRNGTLIGDTDSIRNNIVNNASIRFDQEQDGTFTGSITGDRDNATLRKEGLGTLRLTGLNTLDWAIGNGMLISTTDAFRGNVEVRDGAVMRFEQNASGTYAGVLDSAGEGEGLLQIAAGAGNTITFTADSSDFNGTTSVESGALAVNGELGGRVDVLANGRLQGTGTIEYVVVDGTIAPGNSIGTLNLTGDITFNAGSVFEVEVDATGQADRILASGTTTINGGTVRALAGTGIYAPETRYTILTAAGGLAPNSAFVGVTSNLAFLTPSLSYDANNAYLTMTRNSVAFQNVGVTRNQIATAGGVESLGSGGVYNAVLSLSADQARYAFDQLSGEIYASARTAMMEDSRFIRNAMNDRLRAALGGTAAGPAIWGQGFGSWGHIDGDGNAARLERSTGGFFFGADTPVDTWRFGAVAGYGGTSFNARDRHSSGSSSNYYLGLFGGTNWGDVAFRTGAAYTWQDLSISRNVTLPGLGDSLSGKYTAGTAQVFGELGYGFALGSARFEPFANLALVSVHSGGFAETGGAAALTGSAASLNTTFTTIGVRASTTIDLNGASITAKGMVGWRHAFGDVVPNTSMQFAGSDAFSIGGVPIARDAAVIEAGLDYAFSPNATLGVSYGGQFSAGLSEQSLKANFSLKF